MNRNLVNVLGAGLLACAVTVLGADFPDSDRDGIADAKDVCPATPPNHPALVRGCSELDLAARPSILFDPILKAVDHAVAGGGRLIDDDETQRRLQPLRAAVDKASRSFASGRFCESAEHLTAVEEQIRQVAADTISRRRQQKLAGGSENGDVSAEAIQSSYLRMLGAFFDAAVAEAAAAGRVVAERCRTARPLSLRARVERIDDHDRRIRFEGGGTFVVGADVETEILTEGTLVDVTGTGSVVTGATADVVVTGPLDIQCTFLRIAPAQPFLFASQFTLHSIKGYRTNGILHLERGARFAVQDTCKSSTPPAPGVPFTLRTMKLVLDYTCSGNAAKATLASDLVDGDTPVPIPPCIWGFPWTATLTVTRRNKTCTVDANGTLNCPTVSPPSDETHKLLVMAPHTYCDATYSTVLFDLPDGDLQSFRTSKVATAKPGALFFDDPNAQRTFSARAYTVTNGVSSHPNPKTIGLGQNFAVYNHDFYDPNGLLPEDVTGVDHAAALSWPKLRSKRNGEEFWYSCQLPRLTRDVVDFCGSQPHSLYKLPFLGGYPTWTMGQGNNVANPSATHCIIDNNSNPCYSRFAFDFVAPLNTTIRAARGGVVTFVDESLTGNCSPPCGGCLVNANAVTIRHQDDTIGLYFHMPQNGVSVAQDDFVPRGGIIGKVGNTGCSSEPHLHFQVDPDAIATQSMPIKFRTGIVLNGTCFANPTTTCVTPSLNVHICKSN